MAGGTAFNTAAVGTVGVLAAVTCTAVLLRRLRRRLTAHSPAQRRSSRLASSGAEMAEMADMSWRQASRGCATHALAHRAAAAATPASPRRPSLLTRQRRNGGEAGADAEEQRTPMLEVGARSEREREPKRESVTHTMPGVT